VSVPWAHRRPRGARRERGQLHQKPDPILTVLSFLFGLAMLVAFIYVVV